MEQDVTVVARKLADPSNVDHARQVDMGKLRRYRLARTQEQTELCIRSAQTGTAGSMAPVP